MTLLPLVNAEHTLDAGDAWLTMTSISSPKPAHSVGESLTGRGLSPTSPPLIASDD